MIAVLATRLAAQALSRRAGSVAEACRRLFGIQAQDMRQARWAIAVRSEGATLDTVARAFASREIVRAWCMRGTLHVVPAEDLGWLVGLLGKRNLARVAGRLRTLGIGDDDVARSRKVVEKALRDETMPRDEVFARLAKAGQSVTEQRGVHLLYCLTQAGVLCEAGEELALAEGWIAKPRVLAGDEALAELAKRYVEGHGSASPEDLAFWTGLGKREAKRALEIAAPAEVTPAEAPRALLLPGWDEYLLGYADRSPCLEPAHFERLVPGGNGVFLPMLVLDGHIRGTWRRRVEGEHVAVTVSPFTRLGAAHREAIEGAARDFGAFLGKTSRVSIA